MHLIFLLTYMLCEITEGLHHPFELLIIFLVSSSLTLFNNLLSIQLHERILLSNHDDNDSTCFSVLEFWDQLTG